MLRRLPLFKFMLVRYLTEIIFTFTHGEFDPVAAVGAFVPVKSWRAQLLAPPSAHTEQV